MKKLFILICSLVALVTTHAQPKATEGRTEFQKTQQPAAIITVPYPDDVVEKAIDDYWLKKGIKPKIEAEEPKASNKVVKEELDFKNVVGQESITRFDEKTNRPKQFHKQQFKHKKPIIIKKDVQQ